MSDREGEELSLVLNESSEYVPSPPRNNRCSVQRILDAEDLSHATGADLDALAALFGVER